MSTIKSNFPKRMNCGTYMDIMNGSLYQKLFSGGFLKNEKNIFFTLNTDGIPVFRSSGFSFWPLYFMINELPYRLR